MRKMRLLVMSILLVGLLALPVYAVEINLWSSAEFTPSTGLMVAQPFYQEAYEEFAEKHPDINLTYEILSGSTEALQRVLAAASAGQLPDVGIMDGFWIPRLHERGILQPITKYWSDEERADYMPEVIDAVTFDGDTYALWFYNAWRGLFYRQDILEEVGYTEFPSNYDEFIEMALKLKENGYWAVMLPAMNSEVTFLHMLGFFWGFGGQLVDESGKPVFHEGANRQALANTYQIYYDLVNVHEVMPSDVITMDEHAVRQYLYSNETAMAAQTSSHLMNLKQERPDLYEVLGAATYPMPKGYQGVSHLVGWTYAIFTEDPEKQAAAWEFIAHMTESETLGSLNQAQGHLPVRGTIYENNPFFQEDPIFSQFHDLVFNGQIRPRPAVAIYPVISNSITIRLADVIMGELSIDEAIDEAAEEVMIEWNRMDDR